MCVCHFIVWQLLSSFTFICIEKSRLKNFSTEEQNSYRLGTAWVKDEWIMGELLLYWICIIKVTFLIPIPVTDFGLQVFIGWCKHLEIEQDFFFPLSAVSFHSLCDSASISEIINSEESPLKIIYWADSCQEHPTASFLM